MTAPPTTDEVARLIEQLVNQINHWTPSRFGAASAVAGRTRADVIHTLVQRVADLDADTEGQPRRPVPRLDNDLALPDQLRVVAADLLAAEPAVPVLAEAFDAVTAARRDLTPDAT